MKLNRYEDKYFYYFWKPCGIPSTYGHQKCFLDYLNESDDQTIQSIMVWQREFFSEQDEYGLVNRLDNDTT
jgi:23S rRNA-/tRNA-specific pseudouridylate synthase